MAAPKEGGFKMSLGGLKGKIGLKAAPAQKEAKRPRLALGDDEDDDSNKQQEISGWDAAEGGAVDIGGPKAKEGPRIIPALPNRNWRDDARRKLLTKAPHTQAQNETVVEDIEEPKVQYGLTILKKEEPQEDGVEAADAPAEPMEDVKDNLTDEQRLDKKALDALLHGKSTDDDYVIPRQSEAEAFQNDLRDAPDAPSLDSYEATPIEGFGAALLRGMGWKDDDANKDGAPAKPKEAKRRPALLGIGAKEEAAVGVELGEWSIKGKGKGKKVAQGYNPVALRNKNTGEIITEEELKAKLEQQDLVQEEKPAKERRKHSDDDGREKRRDKKDDRDRDRRRDDDYDSERRRDRKDDRRRDSEYHDSDRRRDKRKDKYKEDDYDSERRRDKRRDKEDYDSGRKDRERRDRSRSPDGKKRDRYRSRSRDTKKDGGRRERSRDSDDRRKRRREKEYDDDGREDRKRRHKDEKY
jgi:hypothetical protein